MVIHLLRLADLLHQSILHDHNHIGNAHRLVLVMGDENRGNLGLFLDTADFLPGLEAKSGIQVGQRLV